MATVPPVFVMCQSTSDPPIPAAFLQGIQAACLVPNMNASIFGQMSAHLANDFTTTDQVLGLNGQPGYFPAGVKPLLRLNQIGGFCVPNNRYRTVTLPISLYGHPLITRCQPAIWDAAYIADFNQAWLNWKNYLVRNNVYQYVHNIESCATSRSPYDPEFFIPSSNNAKPQYMDLTPYWIGSGVGVPGCDANGLCIYGPNIGQSVSGIGYTEAGVISAQQQTTQFLEQTVFADRPDILFSFILPTPSQQKLGFINDPNTVFANAMLAAKVAVSPRIAPNMDSVIGTTAATNWAVSNGLTLGRFGCQLAAGANLPGNTAAGMLTAISFNARWIEINNSKAVDASNFITQFNTAPIATVGGKLYSVGGRLYSVIV